MTSYSAVTFIYCGCSSSLLLQFWSVSYKRQATFRVDAVKGLACSICVQHNTYLTSAFAAAGGKKTFVLSAFPSLVWTDASGVSHRFRSADVSLRSLSSAHQSSSPQGLVLTAYRSTAVSPVHGRLPIRESLELKSSSGFSSSPFYEAFCNACCYCREVGCFCSSFCRVSRWQRKGHGFDPQLTGIKRYTLNALWMNILLRLNELRVNLTFVMCSVNLIHLRSVGRQKRKRPDSFGNRFENPSPFADAHETHFHALTKRLQAGSYSWLPNVF